MIHHLPHSEIVQLLRESTGGIPLDCEMRAFEIGWRAAHDRLAKESCERQRDLARQAHTAELELRQQGEQE